MGATIYDNPDHELLRDQVARFLEREVEPFGAASPTAHREAETAKAHRG